MSGDFSMDRGAQIRFLAPSNIAQGASVAPYHLTHGMPNSASRQQPVVQQSPVQQAQSVVRCQQQTPQRQQSQPQQPLPRPATFARLTRNGPFCPCFSPNDSDTEPSSPVTENATVPAPTGRNMATLARELRARFVTNGGHRSVATTNGTSLDRFAPNPRGRGEGTCGCVSGLWGLFDNSTRLLFDSATQLVKLERQEGVLWRTHIALQLPVLCSASTEL